jgi:hypothetical protein
MSNEVICARLWFAQVKHQVSLSSVPSLGNRCRYAYHFSQNDPPFNHTVTAANLQQLQDQACPSGGAAVILTGEETAEAGGPGSGPRLCC